MGSLEQRNPAKINVGLYLGELQNLKQEIQVAKIVAVMDVHLLPILDAASLVIEAKPCWKQKLFKHQDIGINADELKNSRQCFPTFQLSKSRDNCFQRNII